MLLWRLLCGAMGGVVCAGIRAADLPGGGAGAAVETATLRLTLALGSTRKPIRRSSPVRKAVPAVEVGLSLRMTPALVPHSGGASQGPGSPPGSPPGRVAVPVAAIGGTRTVGSERIGVTASGPANDRPDDDADDPPVPRLDSGAPTVGAVTVRQPSPVAPEAAAAKLSEASAIPDLEGLAWQMAPIRWNGNTGTQVNSFIGDDGAMLTGITNSLSLSANSYIVAPWLGVWNAGYSRSTGNTTSSGTDVKVKSENESNSVSGGVSLVPTSNFPFSANFSHSWADARSGRRADGAGNGDASATSFDLNQRYRTQDGRDNYSASYSSTTLRNGNEKNEFSSLRGQFSTRREFEYEHFLEGVHQISGGLTYVPETAVTNGGKGHILDGDVTHDWKVYEDLGFNSRLQLRNSSINLLQGNALQQNDSTLLLASSSFYWRPYEEEPLVLNGGANFWHINTDTGIDTPIKQDNFNAFLTGTYTFNKNLNAYAGANASTSTGSQSGSDSARFSNLSGNVGVGYSGDTVPLGRSFYNWSVSGGLNSRFDFPGENSIGALVAANHSLVRTIVLGTTQSVGLSIGQGGSFNATTNFGPSASLSHGAGANWSASFGDGLSTSVAANLNHILTSDENTSNNQSVNMGVTGNLNYRYQFSARADAAVTGSLTWTHSRYDNVQDQTLNQVEIDNTDTRYVASLIASYNHFAPFSIPNLQYNATLLINFIGGDSGVSSVGLGTTGSAFNRNLNVPDQNTTASLQQSLRYRIGRLSFSANASVINTGNATSYSLFGAMNREFNGFFDGRW